MWRRAGTPSKCCDRLVGDVVVNKLSFTLVVVNNITNDASSDGHRLLSPHTASVCDVLTSGHVKVNSTMWHLVSKVTG